MKKYNKDSVTTDKYITAKNDATGNTKRLIIL